MLLCSFMKLNILGSQRQSSVSEFNPSIHVYNLNFRWSKIGQAYVVVVVVVVVVLVVVVVVVVLVVVVVFYPFVPLGT